MSPPSCNTCKAILLAITGFAAFSVSDACTKWLTDYYSVFQIMGIKAAFVMCMMIALSPFLGGLKKTLSTRKKRTHIARGLVNTALGVAVTASFAHLPMAQAYTLFFIAPLLTTILAIPIFKEHMHRQGWIAIAAGFAGVLIILRPGFGETNPWLFAALIAAFLIALLFLLAKALDEQETLLSLPFFPVLSDLLLVLPFVWPILFHLTLAHIPLFILSSIMLIIGFVTVSFAFRVANSAIVGPFHYTQILWAVLFGYFIFGDLPDRWTIIGGALIIASGIYLIETERRKR